MGRYLLPILLLGAWLPACSCDEAAGCKYDMDCPGTQVCVAGECVYRTCDNLDCDDDEPCTEDSCESGQCVNQALADGTDCGYDCEGLEWVRRECRSGVCNRAVLVMDCDDDRPCTMDACDAASGCTNDALPQGSNCGSCAVCDSHGDCIDDLSQDGDCPLCQQCAAGGSCVNQPDGFDIKDDCTDLEFCNGLETCDGDGACQAGSDPCPGLDCDEEFDECTGCQADAECPLCKTCDEGRCKNQPAGNDLKDECEPGECATGDCDGSGACGGLPAGTACGDLTPSDCADAGCDGHGHCDQLFTLAASGQVCRESQGDCDAQEVCDGASGDCPPDGLEPGTKVCRAAVDDCDAVEYCDGQSSECPPDQLEPESAVCRQAAGECDAEEYCDGITASCPEDLHQPDMTDCAAGSGVCCSGVCQGGWECCEDDDCSSGNVCYTDACTAGSCSSICEDPACFQLVVAGSAPAGQPLPLQLHTCDSSLEPGQLMCFSERNVDELLANDFETDMGGFSTQGPVSLAPEAQSIVPGASGVQGVKICDDESVLGSFNIDTTGRSAIGMAFSIENATLGDRQMVGIGYAGIDEWRNLLLIGDGLSQPYERHFVILPSEANNRTNLQVRFRLHGGSAGAGSCAYIDDVQVLDLLPMTTGQVLMDAHFDTGMEPFTAIDPDAGDADWESHSGSYMLALDDNSEAYFVTTDPIDTTSIDRYSLLVLTWRWEEMGSLGDGQYDLVQFSLDGSTWNQLAGTGHDFAPNDLVFYRVALPCQAYGVDSLLIRFIAPLTSDAINGDGIYIDDVSLEELLPEYVDWFDPFTAGGEIYTSTVNSATAGDTSLHCTYGCGVGLLTSNQEPATFE